MTSGSSLFKTSRLVARTDFSPASSSWELGFAGFSFKKHETGDLFRIPAVGPSDCTCGVLRLWGGGQDAATQPKGLMEPGRLGLQRLIPVLKCFLEEWVGKNSPD